LVALLHADLTHPDEPPRLRNDFGHFVVSYDSQPVDSADRIRRALEGYYERACIEQLKKNRLFECPSG
jgi:hypothetical protein